jgi:hypothetical protein
MHGTASNSKGGGGAAAAAIELVILSKWTWTWTASSGLCFFCFFSSTLSDGPFEGASARGGGRGISCFDGGVDGFRLFPYFLVVFVVFLVDGMEGV